MLLATVAWIEDGPWARDSAPASAERDLPIARLATRPSAKDGARSKSAAAISPPSTATNATAFAFAAKRLRYAAEVLAPVFDHPSAPGR